MEESKENNSTVNINNYYSSSTPYEKIVNEDNQCRIDISYENSNENTNDATNATNNLEPLNNNNNYNNNGNTNESINGNILNENRTDLQNNDNSKNEIINNSTIKTLLKCNVALENNVKKRESVLSPVESIKQSNKISFYYNKNKCSFTPIQGTMHQQSSHLFTLHDIYSYNIDCYCGNSDPNSHKNLDNEEIPKDDDQSSMSDILNKTDYYKYRSRPTIPLNLVQSSGHQKYTYSLFYNTIVDAYYENNPPSVSCRNWREGILNFHLNVDRDLKFSYIFKDPKQIPVMFEISWCFDFRPTNMVMETLDLDVLLNKDCTHVISENDIEVKSIKWYIHTGLTNDLINYSYAVNDSTSDNNNKIGKIKNEIHFLKYNKSLDAYHGNGNRLKFDDDKKSEEKSVPLSSFQKYNKNIHFNGISTVNYDANKNNSYFWQYLPNDMIGEDNYFGKFDLSKSAYKQNGFILKVVLEGNYLTSIYNDYYRCIVNREMEPYFNLFGYGNQVNTINFYNPKYRFFNINCNLIPEIPVDPQLLNIDKEISIENKINMDDEEMVNNNNDNLNYDPGFIAKNNDSQNLIIKINNNNNNSKLVYIRNNSSIKKENISNIDMNDIKFFVQIDKLIEHSNYFKELDNSVSELDSGSAMKEIELDDTDPISFYQILYYCYMGYLPDQKLYNMYDWLALLMVSKKYSFTSIINYSEYNIKKYMSLETINEINEYAEINNASHLKESCHLFKVFYGLTNINNYNGNSKNEENQKSKKKCESDSEKKKNNENSCNSYSLMNEIFYHISNFFLMICSIFLLLIIMNFVLIISFPIAVIANFIHLLVNSLFKIFEKIYLLETCNYDRDGYSWYKKIVQISKYLSHEKKIVFRGCILYFLVVISGLMLSPVIIVLNLSICLVCQSVLWPFIDSLKAFFIIYNVIKGYEYGLKLRENSVKNNNIDDHNNNTHTSILKSSVVKNEDSTINLKVNENNNEIININMNSSRISNNHNSKIPSLVLPMPFFDEKDFYVTILRIWGYRLKKSIIVCARWWRIIITDTHGFLMIIVPFLLDKIYLNRYEGIRFFWWHKKTVLEKIALV